MKRIAIALSVLTVLVLAAPAGAELCEKCKGKMFIMSVGKCVECGGFTGSGAHKLCRKCSAKLGQCEHCRAPLKDAKRQAIEKPRPTTQPAKINLSKPGTYTSGKWRYDHAFKRYHPALGCSSGRVATNRLRYDGKSVADNIKKWDRIKTPWGMMIFVRGTATAGWEPIECVNAPPAGRLLPSPAKSVPSYLRTLELDEPFNGKTVSATVGQNIIIRLKGNVTTGYSWVVGEIEGDALGQVGKVKYVSDQPPMPAGGRGRRLMRHRVGGGGKYVFTFTAKKPGTAKLTLEYKRGWEKNKPPAKTLTLTVNVKDDLTAQRVKKLKASLDKGDFELVLCYRVPKPLPGKSPYPTLILVWSRQEVRVLGKGGGGKQPVPADVRAVAVAGKPNPNVMRMGHITHVRITKKQDIIRIIDHLAADGVLAQAVSIEKGSVAPAPIARCYEMQISSEGTGRLRLNLGWDMKMLNRLDGLRKVLNGDAAKAMDKLLKRLEGQRKEWTKKKLVTKS